MVPFLSRNVNQPERYKRAYFVAVTIILVAAQPGVLVGILFADEIFLVLLGKEWVPAAPVFMWLGIAGLVQVMTSTMGWLFVSQGRGKHYLMVGAVTAVISITSFVVGLLHFISRGSRSSRSAFYKLACFWRSLMAYTLLF